MTSKEAFDIIVTYVPPCFKEELETIENDLEKYDKMINQTKPENIDFVDRNSEKALYGLHCLALKGVNEEYYWLVRKHIEIIEKDLEILELFKKYLNVHSIGWDTITSLGFKLYLNEIPEEETELLKEWLKYNFGLGGKQ